MGESAVASDDQPKKKTTLRSAGSTFLPNVSDTRKVSVLDRSNTTGRLGQEPSSPISSNNRGEKDKMSSFKKKTFSVNQFLETDSSNRRGGVSDKNLRPKLGMLLGEESADRKSIGRLREICIRIISHIRFNGSIGFVIVLNAIFIGLDTDLNKDDGQDSAAWLSAEIIFTVIFTVELAIRFLAERLFFFRDAWNDFDLVLVLTALIDLFMSTSAGGSNGALSGSTTILRVFRVVRLARIIRLLRFFKELWLLVSGILAAAKFLCWVWLLLLIVIYVFAVFTTRMFGQQHRDSAEIQLYFGGVGKSMFTLFQIMTTEGWADIAEELMAVEPYSIAIILLYMSITTFAMVNVVVAVIVDSTLTQAQELRSDVYKLAQEEEQKAIVKVAEIFRTADDDGDGQLTKNEFERALKLPKVFMQLQEINVDLRDADELFDILDTDESGQLNPKEFAAGILRARGEARAKDLLELHCDLWKVHRRSRNDIKNLSTRLHELEGQQRDMDIRMADSLHDLQDTMTRQLARVAQAIDESKGGHGGSMTPDEVVKHLGST
jgi:voltage-gated sodium channel